MPECVTKGSPGPEDRSEAQVSIHNLARRIDMVSRPVTDLDIAGEINSGMSEVVKVALSDVV